MNFKISYNRQCSAVLAKYSSETACLVDWAGQIDIFVFERITFT